jgi:subtilisin family serine protease
LKFLALLTAFVLMALSFVVMTPLMMTAEAQLSSSLSSDDMIRQLVAGGGNGEFILDQNGVPIHKDAYIITLKDEYFNPVDGDPKFADKDKVKANNNPEINAKVVPELMHEYSVETGELIYEKVREYNGTDTSSLSPLKIQGGYINDVFSHAIRGFEVKNTEDISIFVNDPDIASVEQIPVNIPTFQYMATNGLRMGEHLIPNHAHKPNTIESFPNVDIVVIDFAVLRTHPDLNVAGSGTICSLPSGWTCYPPPAGDGAHGTLAAGIAAARDNLGGVVGPATGARVWSIAICGMRNSDSALACPGGTAAAFDYVTANAATFEVASGSFGLSCGWKCTSTTTNTAINNAINNAVSAGVTVVMAAGNDGVNADNKSYCNASQVICVSALTDLDGKCGGLAPSHSRPYLGTTYTQRDDQRAFFSNYGSVVDLMASGYAWSIGQSLSTSLPGLNANLYLPFIGSSIHGSYNTMGGTSEAAPWVAGAAATLKALHPTWTPAQIKSDLQTNGIAQNAACNSSTGQGGLANNPNSGSSEKILNLAALD